MFKTILFVCALAVAQTKVALDDDTDHMINALDDLAENWGGKGAQFNRTYYKELTTCFGKYNDTLLWRSQIGGWKGMADFYKSNGTTHDYMNRTDKWGECIQQLGNHDDRCNDTVYTEYIQGKSKHIGRNDILYYEPCNSVSNLAFLRGATKICDYPDWSMSEKMQNAMKRTYASLSVGSVFFHGSMSLVGYLYDCDMIALIAYIAYQVQIDFIAGDNTIIKYLQPTPRKQEVDEMVNDIVVAFAETDALNWAKVIADSDFPHHYEIVFAGIVSVAVGLILPWTMAEKILSVLGKLCIPAEQNDFFQNQYLPELKSRITKVHFPITTSINVIRKFGGTLMKIIFAFLYQEKYMHLPGFNTPEGIKIGASLLPQINGMADGLSGFVETDANVNESVGVYPGQEHCKNDQSHSLWHEASANGLLDIVYTADYINKMTIKHYME